MSNNELNTEKKFKRKPNNFYKKFKDLTPAQSLVSGFTAIILIGAVLLALPFASKDGQSVGFLNALFTSTSAVCVTGLSVVNTLEHWTFFGHIVILCLIQIGGLGFMSMVTAGFLFFKKRITLKDRILIKESYNQNELTGMVKLVKNIFKGTFVIEGVSALILACVFLSNGDRLLKSIWKGIFISISAFCNAGFDIIGDSSLTPFQSNWILNIVVMFLIIAGGIGFAVWIDLTNIKSVFKKEISFKMFAKRLTLHTKIVLISTFILIISGALVTFALEYNNPQTLANLDTPTKILASLFQSVTLRTAGFNTIDISSAENSTQFFYIIEMFIGGSPGGTAGGIKTVTMAVIIIAILSALKGRNKMVIFNKHIKDEVLYKALTVIMLNITMVITATMILTLSEADSGFRFLDYFFEAASAVGTVGLTLGLTPTLSAVGKIVIILCMFFGRLGPITIAVALTTEDENKNLFNYPQGKVLVG